MSEHGVRQYSYGCRCEACRAAKSAYVRARRAKAREARLAAEAEGRRHVVEGIKHGIGGYKDFSCRCFTCRLASAESSALYRKRRAEKGAA